MSRAAHAVESKAVVRIEVAVSPRPCLAWAALWSSSFFFEEKAPFSGKRQKAKQTKNAGHLQNRP
jgi:hypothetical protein